MHSEIAVIGAGLGGAAAAALLTKAGFDVRVYEQAQGFSRVGAGIHIGPNVLKIADQIGISQALIEVGRTPGFWCSRDGVTGQYLSRVPLDIYGTPYCTVHRGDVHRLLVDAVERDRLLFNMRLIGLDETAAGVKLSFEDGTTASADIVIGADGIDSCVREELLGHTEPSYSGWIAHRALIHAEKLARYDLEFEECVKWWGPDRHMMAYFTARDEYYYVTGVPCSDWNSENSFEASSREEVLEAFAGYHPVIKALAESTDVVTKWPLFQCDPMPLWSSGRFVLLGDACHPMKPHMGQGAAMAIEDAAVLVRCLQETGMDGYPDAFRIYEAARQDRVARVQQVSNANSFLKTQEDPSWVYAYDVYAEPLGGRSAH